MRFTWCTTLTGFIGVNGTMLLCTLIIWWGQTMKNKIKLMNYEHFHIWQLSCQKQHVKDGTVCITYDAVYTFPHQQIWNMSILFFMTGIEMITKHPGGSACKHTYVQRKIIHPRETKTSHIPTFKSFLSFFFHNYMLPFLKAMEQRQ